MTIAKLQGEELHLLAERAIHWPKQRALIIADLHLGKATHFRKAGIAAPREVEMQNWERLQRVIGITSPQEVLLLGDLFHSELNQAWRLWRALVLAHQHIDFILVDGNHDILAPEHYHDIGMKRSHSVERGPFLFTHKTEEHDALYNLAGHVHPGVRLLGKGREMMKLPCFHFGAKCGLLPAFGAFTGKYLIRPKKEDQVFVVTNDAVVEMSERVKR